MVYMYGLGGRMLGWFRDIVIESCVGYVLGLSRDGFLSSEDSNSKYEERKKEVEREYRLAIGGRDEKRISDWLIDIRFGLYNYKCVGRFSRNFKKTGYKGLFISKLFIDMS